MSACAPLFLHAFKRRDAGAVSHSHSVNALLATNSASRRFGWGMTAP